jgi:hypothetical protein
MIKLQIYHGYQDLNELFKLISKHVFPHSGRKQTRNGLFIRFLEDKLKRRLRESIDLKRNY